MDKKLTFTKKLLYILIGMLLMQMASFLQDYYKKPLPINTDNISHQVLEETAK